MTLRILTYNIRGLPWISCPIDDILSWISKRSCDIVCLQEVFTRRLQLAIESQDKWNIFFSKGTTYVGHAAGFYSGAGLCILVRRDLKILGESTFMPFTDAGGVDRFVSKGLLHVPIEVNGERIDILNTHFQSDYTEFPCFRINYPAVRFNQEKQADLFCQKYRFPLLCGDLNQESFHYFEKFDDTDNITFPETGEHLDHLLYSSDAVGTFISKKTTYFHDVRLSDHIPVIYEFELKLPHTHRDIQDTWYSS
jgi:exonuclease III